MKLSIVGSGYVGMVTGACFSRIGNDVIMVDSVESKVKLVNAGIPTVYEKDLEEIVAGTVREGRLKAVNSIDKAINSSDLSFICVGTPSTSDGKQNLDYIKKVSEEIGMSIRRKAGYHTVVVKSTVVPGTTEGVVKKIIENISGKKAGIDFGLGMNPEFLKEGGAVNDFMKPDRVVIGSFDETTKKVLEDIYAPFTAPKIFTDCTTAEMIKYASNIFLSARVALINEIGNVSKVLGIDTRVVARTIGMDRRIGPLFLNAGAGFGGSCFRKDASAFSSLADELGVDTPIVDAVLTQNERQPLKLVEMLEKRMKIAGKRVAVLGLSFKPDSDDVRDAPSIRVVGELLKKGAEVIAFDPKAMENFRKLFPGITYAASPAEAAGGSDAIIIVTEWKEFSDPLIYGGKLVVDGRGVTKTSNYEGICW
ncbi:MAG: UDP-glucose/GDP-mannose dehydrogenase family protein [Candidatus Thermoplasmatota archaeon]|jgi:UDPglucose 6-dehydrogenase|nr:UDP-glucose/GDP-mannose dehydrogenase family protein [Candidatus Sysuiplasma jiujiangense]MBX8638940.1 UDP-glucose/GDP-mannose dehydrogenase family protein [Candidatus Sysuiplasma jiujiangense]MBX8641000.1 UDP-glucose/GDP-mannose dehydrogenase family protein [Candidatus Sysuiplasma jiujiangense]MCL4316875.1 UDP-glucose/GDP-mannose dehydrogenase family protein [Candidatus Thermoplasmatota archaeon]